LELWPLIASVSVEREQERIQTKQGYHHQHAAIAILHIGRMYDGVHQQTLYVYHDIALLDFDLLASAEAIGINAGPPFSSLFTL